MELSSGVLKRLCCHITNIKSNDERLLEHYQTCVRLLNDEELLGDYPRNLGQVVDDIKKTLINEKRLSEAARISVLLNKLQHSEVLKKKSTLLHLFLCLNRKNSRCSSRSDTGSEASAMFNGSLNHCYGNIGSNYFQAPSLQSSASSNESAMTSNSYNLESETMIRNSRCDRREQQRSGRVARLAAIYKESPRQMTEEKPLSVAEGLIKTKLVQPKPSHLNLKASSRKKEPQTELPEDILLREILFAFQGIEGKIIKIDSSNDCFKVDSKIRMTPGKKDLVMKLIEVGWLYSKVKRFCETHGRFSSSSGLVNQSLVLALREQINEFCRLIAVLESQLHETHPGHESPMEDCSVGLTLRRLLMWTLEPRVNLRSLCIITHAVKDTRGGASASAIYEHLYHGDPTHIQVILHALSQACQPLFVMLTEWLLVGNLQDPHREFFIAADSTVSNEKLWHDKYDIRWCMLPSFISMSQAQKVLASGKSLNFLRHVCNFKGLIGGRDAIKLALQKTTVESLFTQDKSNQLDNLISLTFRTSSAHVLEEILTRHKLIDHLRALKRYLLIEQGDFINHLMEIIEPLLCQPANKVQSHKLSSLLENAIAASNAQYEDPDIINRLDFRLLECSPGETGWDVFSLDYHVDGPIGTVFTADCMRQYLMLFNILWKAKRMEWILAATWKQQTIISKKCRVLPEFNDILHHIQILLTEMIHLVQQMAYYTTFEVLECSWHSMMTDITSARSLDDILGAHHKFLRNIVAGALLDDESRDVRMHLRTLYDLMMRLELLQGKLYNSVTVELSARENFEREKKALANRGDFATSDEMESEETDRRYIFNVDVVTNTRTELKVLTTSYQGMVQSFLLMLAQHENENLNLLSSRLDFNEYYHRKDDRLGSKMTYLHKRKSMGTSFCQDKFSFRE